MNRQQTIEAIRRRHARDLADPIGVKAVKADVRVKQDSGMFVSTANTAAIDLDDEVVVPKGADTSYFFTVRALFYNHDYTLPIGTLRAANLKGGQWEIHGQMSETDFAQDVLTMMREGVIRGVSIGFVPTDAGPPTKDEKSAFGERVRSVVRSWLWLEVSPTAMPCNPEALISAVKSNHISRRSAVWMGLDDTERRKYWDTGWHKRRDRPPKIIRVGKV